MKKAFAYIAVFALILSLSACSSTKLSDAFKEDEVISRAEKTVAVISTLDYDAIVPEFRDDLESQVTPEQLENAWSKQLNAAGKFVKYSSETVFGQKDKSTGEDYAVAVLVCKYENSTLTYTISMDKDLNIIGMYMK